MSFAFHHDKDIYFRHQYLNSKAYIIPYIKKKFNIHAGCTVLEIGCAEGGVLQAFCELGCKTTGVELSSSKVENARKYMQAWIAKGLFHVIQKNIYEVDFQSDFRDSFDIIVLKDTIEHIPDQAKLLRMLHPLLKEQGILFLGFPPWHMPWGGHQQICQSKFLMFLPYFHLLPTFMYRGMLKLFGETSIKIQELLEIKETGITTYQLERFAKAAGFLMLDRTLFLINPIYEHKFGLAPVKQPRFLSAVPLLRDLFSTTAFYLFQKKS